MSSHLNVLLRDTFFGQLANRLSKRKLFRHDEEQPDFVVPEQYTSKASPSEKPKQVTERPADQQPPTDKDERQQRVSSEETIVGDSHQSDDHITVDWYGPNDPENPLNWSKPRKVFVTFCICLITTSVYAGSSIYTPGLMGAEQSLHVAQVPATLGLSMFVFGYAVGPLVLSPLSEIPAVGRTAPYIITLAIYVALQVPAALTNNFAAFIIVRFLQGFFGSPPLATGGASLVDMYEPVMRPIALGIWGCSAAAGPSLGPVLSSFAIENKNWHWHAWIMLWLAGFSLIFLFFTLPETSSTNILVRRARRLRKLTGNDRLKSEGEIEQANMTGTDVLMMVLVRPFQFTLTEPIVIALNLYIAYVYCLLYLWFESFPIVFLQGYGFSLGVSTLPYLSLLVGAFIGYFGFCIWNLTVFKRKFEEADGKPAPEERLPPAFVGALCYPICLFWFAWSANRTSYWSPIIASSFFGIGTSLMFQAALNYLPDAYPRFVASVLASNDFTRSMSAGAFPLFASAMFKRLGIDWGNSLLGFLSVIMIPIPFVLYKYGPNLRARTRFAN